MHLTLEEAQKILSRDAGEELPADAEKLAQYARRRLRHAFAEADAGITGVNFAVAETGTIVLVSNEGNARLTTALPRIHIAVMGMEKVIPRLADLPVFLKVLARGATGQKLSIYTSLITGCRNEDELDGAGVSFDRARQWPVEDSRWAVAGEFVLHPLRGVFECLSHLSQHRRACVWRRIRWTDRRRADATL